MKKLGKAILLCMCIMNTFVCTQLEAKEIRTEQDCNTIMKERCEMLDFEQLEELRKPKYIEINCILSFYTTLNSENGFGAIDAQGNKLKFGTIAIPREIELGTQFSFDYFGDTVFTGTDRGSKKHIRIDENGNYRIDVCIERLQGQSDSQYLQYVNNMGKVETKGKMYIE